jgi:hypothetical protein
MAGWEKWILQLQERLATVVNGSRNPVEIRASLVVGYFHFETGVTRGVNARIVV